MARSDVPPAIAAAAFTRALSQARPSNTGHLRLLPQLPAPAPAAAEGADLMDSVLAAVAASVLSAR